MGIIGTIFVGLIVGLLARALKPGDDKLGWIMTILLGKLCKTNESRRCSSPTAVHAVLTQIFC